MVPTTFVLYLWAVVLASSLFSRLGVHAQNVSEPSAVLSALDSVGLTNYTAVVRQLQSAGLLGSGAGSLGDALLQLGEEPGGYTLFIPNNDACKNE